MEEGKYEFYGPMAPRATEAFGFDPDLHMLVVNVDTKHGIKGPVFLHLLCMSVASRLSVKRWQ